MIDPPVRDGEGVKVCRCARVVLDRLRPGNVRGPHAHLEAARRFFGDRCPPTLHRPHREIHIAELAETPHLDDEVLIGIWADEEKRRREL